VSFVVVQYSVIDPLMTPEVKCLPLLMVGVF